MYKTTDIQEWHKKTFPMATFEGQVEKIKEEFIEFVTAKDVRHKLEELADMYIVGCGIGRFSWFSSSHIISLVMKLGASEDFTMKEFIDAVETKMRVNMSRKWDKKNGQYRHKEANLIKKILEEKERQNLSYQKSAKDYDFKATMIYTRKMS